MEPDHYSLPSNWHGSPCSLVIPNQFGMQEQNGHEHCNEGDLHTPASGQSNKHPYDAGSSKRNFRYDHGKRLTIRKVVCFAPTRHALILTRLAVIVVNGDYTK